MPPRRSPVHTKRFANELRHNTTDAENRLWGFLRNHCMCGVHFRRQHAMGIYVVDFCSPRHKLVIEIDGKQHQDLQEYDAQRTEFLEGLGYRVIRFWNDEVLNDFEKVLETIQSAIQHSP